MPLWGNRRLSNNAVTGFPPMGGFGVNANGQAMFANTTANGFVANLATGVHGISSNTKSLLMANVAYPGTGYRINDLLAVTDTGAIGSNASVAVDALTIVTALVGNVLGTGYANNDIINVAGTGTKATINVVSVGNSIIGNISTIAILTGGKYTANILTSNVATSNVTGNGVGFTINVATGISTVAIQQPGLYQVNPTTMNLNAFIGGSGTTANANLSISLTANKVGGSGWILKNRRADGKTTYEILVAARSIWNGNTDTTGVI